MILGPTIQDNKVYVTLRGVKNPRLLFPCQVSVALQEGLLSICVWGGGCGEEGVGRWVWGSGCGEVDVDVVRWVWVWGGGLGVIGEGVIGEGVM